MDTSELWNRVTEDLKEVRESFKGVLRKVCALYNLVTLQYSNESLERDVLGVLDELMWLHRDLQDLENAYYELINRTDGKALDDD